ncbi:nuclear export mediator factor nemf-like protein [Chrysochromulina tobinii]|uniref:Ribosome quality control complex subunit 2 n=1 Tax=Chrysochromulina tobinii TaxID=1460289 RepID=A0A0M0JPQ3_9EUKA|nr:nuclear export mediator factor nemf-like protein [Chrysochromulina tobinii]|eukprot:KOO28559.1 nuclear export mediator factor nemf-like protein [Chrysochromulina sp. CCMP291]
MVLALQSEMVGYRVINVYDLDPKTYILKLAKPDSKMTLLVQSGIRLHTTAYARDKEPTPSVFTLKLRKHLNQRRVNKIEQLGSDRVIVLTCGEGDFESHLVVELYDKGNIVLTDKDHIIITLLRNSKFDVESKLTVGEPYSIVPRQESSAVSAEALSEAMQAADGGTTAIKLMMRQLPLGKEMAEHALVSSELPLNTKMNTSPWKDGALLRRLETAITNANTMLEAVAAQPGGIIVLKQAQSSAASGAGAGGDDQASVSAGATASPEAGEAAIAYDEFAPFELAQHAARQLVRFASFSEAVDEYFSKVEVQKMEAAVAQQQNAAWKKVDKIRQAQEARVNELVAKEEEDMAKARLIELNAAAVDTLLSLLRNGVTSGMDWGELQTLIADAAKAGDELASMVHSLDLLHKQVTLVLTEEGDDEGEDVLTRPATAVKLDITLSALANARSYYTQRKAAAVKTAKTGQAAEQVVRQAEKKAAHAVASMKVQTCIRQVRTPFWWEKFDWFISSENLLVLLAKDLQQTDMLVRRHLRAKDTYVHADVQGAPVCVVKCGAGLETVPQLTLAQAGDAVMCRSDAWTSRAVTSAWWAPAHEVTKQDRDGSLLPTGMHRVLGQRNYLPPSQNLMGLGILFRVALPNVAAHLDERRVRGAVREADGTVVRLGLSGGLRVTPSAPSASRAASSAAAPAVVDINDSVEAMADEEGIDDGASDATSVSLRGAHRLTAKQRRQAKKGKLVDGGKGSGGSMADEADEAPSDVPRANEPPPPAPKGDRGAQKNNGKAAVAAEETRQQLARGKHGKLKKMKAKYADQDEEDTQLALDLLGSAGKSKKQLAVEEKYAQAEKQRAEAEAKARRQKEKQQRQLEREKALSKQRTGRSLTEGALAADEAADDEEVDAVETFGELASLLEEPSMGALPEDRRALVVAQDTLTAHPKDEDTLLFAIPVCAPYAVLTGYRYKIKLTPGNQKRGKAAKQAVGLLSASAASGRERDLMRAVPDDELVRVMIGSVKVAAAGKMLQAQKRDAKARAKEAAKERANPKEPLES